MTEGGDARLIEINVDGPSVITARLSNVSGSTVRLCILRQDRDADTVCNQPRTNGPAVAVFTGDGPSLWLVQAQGRGDSNPPTGNLTVTFNSLEPLVTLRSFRFNGTSDEARNGFTAVFTSTNEGEIAVRGNFDEDSFNYRLTLQPCSIETCDVTDAGQNFELTAPGAARTDYSVRVASTDETTEPSGASAFVQATISWH